MLQQFTFKGNRYCTNTIVKIHNKHRKQFGCYHHLKFTGINNKGKYEFCALHNCWDHFAMSEHELDMCIEEIAKSYTVHSFEYKPNVEAKDIDGIVPAWTWFVLALIASIMIAGMVNKILMPIAAFGIFTAWRLNKMKGE